MENQNFITQIWLNESLKYLGIKGDKKMENKISLDEILLTFCAEEGSMRPAMEKPTLIDNYVYATNGHYAIKINKSLLSGEYTHVEGYPNITGVWSDAKRKSTTGIFFFDPPIKLDVPLVDIFEAEVCPGCKGDGFTIEECFECGNEYEKDCRRCKGKGTIGGTKVIGQKMDVSYKIGINNTYFSLSVFQMAISPFNKRFSIETKGQFEAAFINDERDLQVLMMPSVLGDNSKVSHLVSEIKTL